MAINPVEGQEWYFDYKGILEATKLCIEHKVIILGYEGFDKDANKIVPDMEAILDNSSGENFSLKEIKLSFFNNIKNAESKIWTITYSA